MLKRIEVPPNIVEWTRKALLESHADQTRFREEALKRLATRKTKVAGYADQAYQDRLEGRISIELWERKTAQRERERDELNREIEAFLMASRLRGPHTQDQLGQILESSGSQERRIREGTPRWTIGQHCIPDAR